MASRLGLEQMDVVDHERDVGVAERPRHLVTQRRRDRVSLRGLPVGGGQAGSVDHHRQGLVELGDLGLDPLHDRLHQTDQRVTWGRRVVHRALAGRPLGEERGLAGTRVRR